MENKYFTPDIEDLYVGYKLEIKGKHDTNWQPVVLGKDAIWHKFTNLENLGQVMEQLRVPYLTKEQIEAEGWELIQIYPKGACIFQKGTKEEGCELTYDFQEHRIHFTKLYFYGLDDKYTRTKLTWRSLECKDINSFRKIIKLLEI